MSPVCHRRVELGYVELLPTSTLWLETFLESIFRQLVICSRGPPGVVETPLSLTQ